MKTKGFYYWVIIGILLYSCNESEETFINEISPVTRAIVDENRESISNPDLIWNWENISEILLNAEKITSGQSVTAPWADGSSSPLPETFRKDIKKEDGWKMLFHTFKKTGLDARQNYMCFYNQFTGFLKVFYYYEGEELHSGAQWYIKTNEGIKTALLDKPAYLSNLESAPSNNDILLVSNLNDVPTTGIEPGWNGFEFQVSRYCTDLTSMDFKIGAYEKQITNYNLLGKEFLETLGTITTKTESSSGTSKAIANIAGPEAKRFIDKLGGNVFGESVILGQSIQGLIGSIPSTGYITAFKAGLDMIFGKSTSTSTSDVKLTTTGTVEMNGTSSTVTTAGIPTLNFNLYEVLNPTSTRSNPNLVTTSSSGNGHYLGVWTLKKKPVVYYEKVVMVKNIKPTGAIGNGTIEISGDIPVPRIMHYDIEPIINPDILPYIQKYSFSVKFVVYRKLEGTSYYTPDINDMGGTPCLYVDGNNNLYSLSNGHDNIVILVDKNSYVNNGYGCYWYDWGHIKGGRLLAVVSLDMTCLCYGKQTEYYQSKVFEVDYGIDSTLTQPKDVHHPPYPIVLNYGIPFTNRYNWEERYN